MQSKPYPHNSSLAARRTRLAEAAAAAAPVLRTVKLPTKEDFVESTDELLADVERNGPIAPAWWIKGQLLNVRNNGAEYVVTLLGEEFDPRHPERALKFPNPARCQDFVSKWYQREHADPRAF